MGLCRGGREEELMCHWEVCLYCKEMSARKEVSQVVVLRGNVDWLQGDVPPKANPKDLVEQGLG